MKRRYAEAGKGSRQRPTDALKFSGGMDRIDANRGCSDKDRKEPCDKCNCWLWDKVKK